MLESLTYSDIALVPRYLSSTASRDQINLSTKFLGHDLRLPILSAPMKTVTGVEMAQILHKLGCLPVLARSNLEADLDKFANSKPAKPAVSIGLKDIDSFQLLRFQGVTTFCIDVANGFNTNVGDAVKYMRETDMSNLPLYIIAGNVGSVEGYNYLSECGVDAVRVGIGAGAMCSTSIATGIGMGQVTLIKEINDYRNQLSKVGPALIADGGIKEPGDVCKALALGADVVMVGTILAGTTESPGHIIELNGSKYKTHAGEASKHTKGNDRYVEGASTLIKYKGSVEPIIKSLEDGLRSSMSYMGCETLKEFRHLESDCFVRLSNNARLERHPQITGDR